MRIRMNADLERSGIHPSGCDVVQSDVPRFGRTVLVPSEGRFLWDPEWRQEDALPSEVVDFRQ